MPIYISKQTIHIQAIHSSIPSHIPQNIIQVCELEIAELGQDECGIGLAVFLGKG